jgi:hypothetical protein
MRLLQRSIFVLVWVAGLCKAAVTVTGLSNGAATIVLDNGIVRAEIIRSTAGLKSIQHNGTELLAQTAVSSSHVGMYHSWENGAFENPAISSVAAPSNTSSFVDIAMLWHDVNTYSKMDMTIHYALASGDSALYSWSVLDHPASYDTLNVGFWLSMLWNGENGTDFTCENAYVDSLRHGLQPTYADLQNSASTGIAEILKLTQGKFNGAYNGKYEYSSDLWSLDAFGHASDVHRVGLFVVYGNHEWLGYGPIQQDLNATADAVHIIYNAGHYDGPGYTIPKGTAYHKIFGPFLLYCNGGKSADSLWLDAKARAAAESKKWPYTWVQDTSYHASDRGKVSGRIGVVDPMKAVSTAGWWVGLAQIDTLIDPVGTDPQFEARNYQYWVKTDASGNFVLYNVRPGTYRLYSWGPGEVGQYVQDTVKVAASSTTALGILHWTIPRAHGPIAWEIGIPDRKSAEFVGGKNFFKGFNWLDFPSQFSNPLVYTVGKSNWATGWNYCASAWYADTLNLTVWPWEIHFTLDSVAVGDTALLTIALASANYARIDISVDGVLAERYYPVVTGGNAMIRQSDHAKYDLHTLAIPTSKLSNGAHVITLTQGRAYSATEVMYDYVSLEVPKSAPVTTSVKSLATAPTDIRRNGTTLRIESPGSFQVVVNDASGRIVCRGRGTDALSLDLSRAGHSALSCRVTGFDGTVHKAILAP